MLSSVDILLNKVISHTEYKNVEVLGSSMLLRRYENFPIGTPTTLIKIKDCVYHLISFPGLCCRKYPTTIKILLENTKVLSKLDIINHEVIHTDTDIDGDYLYKNNIITKAQKLGAITLHTDNIAHIVKLLKTLFSNYKKVIKLSGRSGFKDNLSMYSINEIFDTEIYITFLNVGSCLPIFDTRNTDCIGMLINIGNKEGLSSIYDGAYIFFNDVTNILKIDGVASFDQRRQTFILLKKGEDLRSFCDIIDMYVEKSKNKSKKMPENKKESCGFFTYDLSSTPIYTGTSSSYGISTTGTYSYWT